MAWVSMLLGGSAVVELLHMPDPSRVRSIHLLHVAGFGLMAAMVLLAGLYLVSRLHAKFRCLGAVALLSLTLSMVWLQRSTDLGLLGLRGISTWVDVAARTESAAERRLTLEVALQGTQYALNVVENDVLDRYDRAHEVQAELFSILADLAPNERWQRVYLARRDEVILPET